MGKLFVDCGVFFFKLNLGHHLFREVSMMNFSCVYIEAPPLQLISLESCLAVGSLGDLPGVVLAASLW